MAIITACSSQRLTRTQSLEELERLAGWPQGAARQNGAGTSRQKASLGTDAIDLAADAASRLARGSLDDLAWCACAQAVPLRAMPTNSATLHARLGLPSTCASVDLNSSCLSFISSLALLGPMADSTSSNILLAVSEISARGLNFSDPKSSALFGDGAAACRIEPGSGKAGLLVERALLETHSKHLEACTILGGGNANDPLEPGYGKFAMDGTNLYKAAAQAMPAFIERLCRGGFPMPSEADWVVPHQASAAAMALLARKLGISGPRLVDIFDTHGNQVSASIPTALASLWASGNVKKGHRILLLGTGAGLALGGAWLRASEDLT